MTRALTGVLALALFAAPVRAQVETALFGAASVELSKEYERRIGIGQISAGGQAAVTLKDLSLGLSVAWDIQDLAPTRITYEVGFQATRHLGIYGYFGDTAVDGAPGPSAGNLPASRTAGANDSMDDRVDFGAINTVGAALRLRGRVGNYLEARVYRTNPGFEQPVEWSLEIRISP